MQKSENPKIFRSVKKKPDTTTKFRTYKNTMRRPGNVPYVIDNLWEWKRPKRYPNRRYSVFASPQPNLAIASGPKGGTVYRVKFKGKYRLCQLEGYSDSKDHQECKLLRKLLFDLFGQEWIDGKLTYKQEFGKLWIPCLSKDDMNHLFGANEKLRELRDEIYNSINYWDDVVLIKDGKPIPDEKGELFFEPLEGYWLREMEE